MIHDAIFKTWVEVSKKALENNVAVIKRLAAGKLLMAVVKSNAYGHGLAETAKLFLKYGVDWVGTDSLDEALLLRRSGLKSPVLVLGYTPVEWLGEAARSGVKLTLYGPEILATPSAFKKKIAWHLKIDTGMSRQGVLSSELPDFVQRLQNHPEMKIEGVLTHFAKADDPNDLSQARQQLARFREAVGLVQNISPKPLIVHAAATPAFFSLPESGFDLIRIGVGFYGLWPSDSFKDKFRHLGLRPALSWKTRVVQVKTIPRGAAVGYGATERVKKDTKIAVLPVGYYDGYFRGLSSRGEVLIRGQRCRVLGRVSMNLVVVEANSIPDLKVWEEAVLLGASGREEITAEEIAKKLETISYEVVARINPLLPRLYV